MSRPTSFKLHIRPLFREIDIERMNAWFDLSKYDDVRDNSTIILSRLKGDGNLMPPEDNDGPWPEEWINLFDRWINEEHPE